MEQNQQKLTIVSRLASDGVKERVFLSEDSFNQIREMGLSNQFRADGWTKDGSALVRFYTLDNVEIESHFNPSLRKSAFYVAKEAVESHYVPRTDQTKKISSTATDATKFERIVASV